MSVTCTTPDGLELEAVPAVNLCNGCRLFEEDYINQSCSRFACPAGYDGRAPYCSVENVIWVERGSRKIDPQEEQQ